MTDDVVPIHAIGSRLPLLTNIVLFIISTAGSSVEESVLLEKWALIYYNGIL